MRTALNAHSQVPRLLFRAALAMLQFGVGFASHGADPYGLLPPSGRRWTLTFDDEFTQDASLDTNKWNGGAGGTDWCNLNFQGKPGGAYMFAETNDPCGQHYEGCTLSRANGLEMRSPGAPSAALQTGGTTARNAKFIQKFGFWEARFKVPHNTHGEGTGLHSDFWMHPIPEGLGSPTEWLPEINVGERPTWDANLDKANNQIYFGIHDYGAGGTRKDNAYGGPRGTSPLTDLSADWHTYGLYWRDDDSGPYGSMQFYLDGKPLWAPYVLSSSATNMASGIYVFLLLDNDNKGADWTNNPFCVQYVRVWRLDRSGSSQEGGHPAATTGPNLMADASFESMDPRAFTFDTPFRMAADPHAHSGKADVEARLSSRGGRMYSRVDTWKNTDYVSSIWLRGSGSGTLFVATEDLSRRLAATNVVANDQWHEADLPWNSGGQTRVAVGFQDDVSPEGVLHLDDFYTGLKDAHTVAFVAPPAYDPTPHAPPGCHLIFDEEFNDSSTIDVNNTQKDGYKWYVKGMWFPSTSPSMYEILPSYKGASGVLAIKDAPVGMSWNFATTFFDDSSPEGYRGTVFLPGKGIYYEARMACDDLPHITTNGWAGFWSGTMPIASRPRNGNPPPWSMSVENTPMPGWPGKWETIENDIMEYNPSWGHPQQFDSTIHDWSSSPRGNIGNFNAVVYPPAKTDFTQWHTYGQLWIPATAENGWHGYRQVYFDGVPQQAICWIGNQISETSQPAGSYLFSLCDGTPKSPPLWRNLMIGGAMGGTPNTFFDYVRVYAIDPKASIKIVGR